MSTPPISKYPDMGEVTTLRLELGRERDRADALAAALRKEVLAIVREEIQKQLKACGDEFVRQVKGGQS